MGQNNPKGTPATREAEERGREVRENLSPVGRDRDPNPPSKR